MRGPVISRPVYLSGAPVSDNAMDTVKDVCKKTGPLFALVGATLLGVTASYFVPKVFDYYLANKDGDGDNSPTVDLDVEPRDD